MKKIDLHIHTLNSDGEYSIKEIIQKLIDNQIQCFSITDHDNVNSCIQMESIKLPKDMKHIPGVEFSAILKDFECHILGYNIDYREKIITEKCAEIKFKKRERIKKILEFLQINYNIQISEQQINSILNKKGTLGRNDLYLLLLQMGYGSKQEIYEKYLTGKHVESPYKSQAEEIIDIIHKVNGQSILAHPKEIEEMYHITIEEIIEDFIELGIDGIEIYNSIHTLKDVKRYIELAKKYNLITTGGSDYHGEKVKNNVSLGYSTIQKQLIYSEYINFKL